MSNDPRPYRTKTGRQLTDADIEALADEAERGYDVDQLAKRPGRPRIGSAPALTVPVRLDADLHAAAKVQAATLGTSLSELVREALRAYLAREPRMPTSLQTVSGRTLSDSEIEGFAAEAEADYDVSALRTRPTRRSRGRAKVVPVRMPPELKAEVEHRAEAEATSVSEIVRAALRQHLADPSQKGEALPLPTHRDDYPILAAWLEEAEPHHAWVRLLDVERFPDVTPPTLTDLTLGPLELLVHVVSDARPNGLSLFRRSRFRDPDPENVLSARLELLCAWNLAVRHVPFAFGGTGEPDLTWNVGTSAQAWLEIHRGAFRVFDQLQRSIEAELDAKDATLTVRVDEWPIEVSDRNVVHSRISRAIDAAVSGRGTASLSLPELGKSAVGVVEAGTRPIGLAGIRVVHGDLRPSEAYLASLAARLARKVNVDKAAQARKGSWSARTVLLVDISTAHLAQLLGSDGLSKWLEGIDFEWPDVPFAGVAVCFSHLHGILLQGVCRYRPDIHPDIRSALDPVLTAIGLLPTDQHGSSDLLEVPSAVGT